MGAEETKHDLLLKRAQITIAILAGVTTLVIGVYNVKKNVLTPSGPGKMSLSVRADDGPPVSGAFLELYNSQNTLVSSESASREGLYEKEGLESGGYFLKTSKAGFEPQGISLQVSPNKTTRLEIVLRKNVDGPKAEAGSPLRSALEETGASWIKSLGKAKPETADQK